jgi:hypothetical protein
MYFSPKLLIIAVGWLGVAVAPLILFIIIFNFIPS